MITQTLVIIAGQLAILAAVILYRLRAGRRLRALPRRAVTARDMPAGHPDAGFVLSHDDGRAWTALTTKEHA
jgi:hypothetical protein